MYFKSFVYFAPTVLRAVAKEARWRILVLTSGAGLWALKNRDFFLRVKEL